MTMMQTRSHAETVISTSALAICTENEISKKKKKRAEDDGLVLLLLHVTRALKEACCLPSGTRDPEGWMRRFACGGRIWPGVDSPGLSGKGSALD